MSASGKSNVTDENLDKYSVELIWRRYTGHMETGKAWKDELKVVLFRQKYGVWWVCKLNTDLIGKSPIKIGTSETSFCNAAGGAGITSVFATLDKIHREISSTENGFHNTTAVGPIYGILLQKTDSSGQSYSGIAFSYATMAIVYFAYVGGTFYIKVYG